MISSELLTDLLTPDGEGVLAPSAQARLQAFFEVLPLALMEFRLEGVRLVLVAANAAARRGACPAWARCAAPAPMPWRCLT